MRHIPLSLIIFRLLLSPLVLYLSSHSGRSHTVTICILLYAGLVSDILDGIIARHLNVSTPTLRRMDSQTDMIFWLSAGFALWFIYPGLIHQNALPITILIFMEAACYAVSLFKFRRETCTHAYLSKLWGITLLIAFSTLFVTGKANIWFQICVATGIISHLDRILITLILPGWTHDVPSAYHAYRIRIGKSIHRIKLFN